MAARRVSGHSPIPIVEGVELLDIAQGQLGLLRHPGPQPRFQGRCSDCKRLAGRLSACCGAAQTVRTRGSSGVAALIRALRSTVGAAYVANRSLVVERGGRDRGCSEARKSRGNHDRWLKLLGRAEPWMWRALWIARDAGAAVATRNETRSGETCFGVPRI